MAVYTPVPEEQLGELLSDLPVGELVSVDGIESGIENSNFYVQTTQGRFVLTLFERLTHDQVSYYLALMHHLASRGINCPDPVADSKGNHLFTLSGKPAALVTCLPGKAQMQPTMAHCRIVGQLVANMHLAASDFGQHQPNLRGIAWWREAVPRLAPALTDMQRELLEDELATQNTVSDNARFRELPASAVHADLFRDNVLFEGDATPTSGGAIDFYFAGDDSWIFDLAVTVNDWCIDDLTGSFDPDRLACLLEAYQAVRPITADEKLAWPYALRAAALRFWLSRLDDASSPRPAEMLTPKDPAHFERILMARRRDSVTVGQSAMAG